LPLPTGIRKKLGGRPTEDQSNIFHGKKEKVARFNPRDSLKPPSSVPANGRKLGGFRILITKCPLSRKDPEGWGKNWGKPSKQVTFLLTRRGKERAGNEKNQLGP